MSHYGSDSKMTQYRGWTSRIETGVSILYPQTFMDPDHNMGIALPVLRLDCPVSKLGQLQYGVRRVHQIGLSLHLSFQKLLNIIKTAILYLSILTKVHLVKNSFCQEISNNCIFDNN